MNTEENKDLDNRFMKLLHDFTKFKTEFIATKEENTKLKEINSKLEKQFKDTLELEKSHRHHLINSREIIGNLQETVTELVYTKEQSNKLKEDITLKNKEITDLEMDKEKLLEKHNENLANLRHSHSIEMDNLNAKCRNEILQVQNDLDTQIAQLKCIIEEQKNKIEEIEKQHEQMIYLKIMEYEEKLEHGASQLMQLNEQTTSNEASIAAYRTRIAELEEIIKQNQVRQTFGQKIYNAEYENRVERPYSEDKGTFSTVSSNVCGEHSGFGYPNNAAVVSSHANKTQLPRFNYRRVSTNTPKRRKLFNFNALNNS